MAHSGFLLELCQCLAGALGKSHLHRISAPCQTARAGQISLAGARTGMSLLCRAQSAGGPAHGALRLTPHCPSSATKWTFAHFPAEQLMDLAKVP